MRIVRRTRSLLGGLSGLIPVLLGRVHKEKSRAFSGRYITAICFHNPRKAHFEKYIKWFKRNGYVFISADTLITILNDRSAPPRGAVWVSFDDGWRDNLVQAIPTIIEYNVPSTFFIPTDPVERTGVFWWTFALRYSQHLPDQYKSEVKKLWDIEEGERKRIVKDLEDRFGKDVERQAMTIDEVRYISNLPQVTIGCHTVNHVVTPNCTDAELDFEIKTSKQKLESWVGKEVKSFAYPNGDYGQKEKDCLNRHGIELAATTEGRLISVDDDPYFLPRLPGLDDGFFYRNLCDSLGIGNPFVSRAKALWR